MTSLYKRRAFASVTACALAIAMGLATPAATYAAEDDLPIDAVPLIRPHTPTRGLQPSEEPLAPPTPEAAPLPEPSPAPQATPLEAAPQSAPAAEPGALPAPEPAIMRIHFDAGDATLSPAALADVQSFAASFKSRGGRVALKSYAGTAGDTSSNARRLALRRVLAVREVLIGQGINAERLQVQALGGARDAGPLDRVDIVKSGR